MVLAPSTTSAGALPSSSPLRLLDATGDAGNRKVDIQTVVVHHRPTVKIIVDVVQAVPFYQWGPKIDAITVGFNETVFLDADRDGAAIYAGNTLLCPVAREYFLGADRYRFTFPRTCLGNPATIRVFVTTLTSDYRGWDHSPQNRFSRRVTYSP